MSGTQNLQNTIRIFTHQLQRHIHDFVCGHNEGDKGLWVYDRERFGDLDPDVAKFLQELKLPSSPNDTGSPSLLFHGLAILKSDSLTQTLTNVFRPHKHMLLVNVSGSGKTRIVLEGLSRNWGFYFVCHDDGTSIGSQDLPVAIERRLKNHPLFKEKLLEDHSNPDVLSNQLAHNRDIADCIFAQVLLARLVIFEQFLDSMKLDMENSENCDRDVSAYRERWLQMQTRPGLLNGHSDIFASLVEAISADNHSLDILASEVSRVRDSVLKKLPVDDTSRLFLVIDEAQVAANTFPRAFKSSGQHLKGGVSRKDRPVLRQIVYGWSELLKVSETRMCASYVITGTGVSLLDITEAVASSTGKNSGFGTAYLTGAFDSAETQRVYIAKYVPEVILNSEIGKILVERMWFWLRGRYRFTAGFLCTLIEHCYHKPLSLLNAYIKHYADFTPMDCSEGVLARQSKFPLFRNIEHTIDVFPLDFGSLSKDPRLRRKVVEIAYHSFLMSFYRGSLGTDEKELVNLGFARYASRFHPNASIDEHLIILACLVWADKEDTPCDTLYQYLCDELRYFPSGDGPNGFEHYLAYYFAIVFRRYTALNTVFDFLDNDTPLWSRNAKLVALHKIVSGGNTRYEEGVTEILGTEPISQCIGNLGRAYCKLKPTDFMQWLSFGHHEPFFFPKRSATGDLIFILKLEGTSQEPTSFIWVCVQAKLHAGNPRMDGNLYLSNDTLHHAIKTVTPRRFYLTHHAVDIPPRTQRVVTMSGHAGGADNEDERVLEDNDDEDQDRPDERDEVLEAMCRLPRRADEHIAGRFSCLRIIASWSAIIECSELEPKHNKDDTRSKRRIVWSDPDKNDGHPLAILNRRTFIERTQDLSPTNFLKEWEEMRKEEAFLHGVTIEDLIYESQEEDIPSGQSKARATRSSKKGLTGRRKKAIKTLEKKASEARKRRPPVDSQKPSQSIRRSNRLSSSRYDKMEGVETSDI